MKNICIGDIVKVKNNDIVRDIEAYLEHEISNNSFEVKFINIEDDRQKTEWFVLAEKDKDITNTKPVALEKKELEVVTPTNIQISSDYSFRELFEFNSTGKEIFKKISNMNVRSIEKNYFKAELVDGEYMISYIPFEKLKYFDGDFYDNDLRVKYKKLVKPIKVVQEIIKANDKTFKMSQETVDGLLSCINKEINADFVLVSGEDITKYYNLNMYVSQDGTLGSSCMKHEKLGKMGVFHLYEDYAKMLILKDRATGKIYGRAIVWDLQSDDEKFKGKRLVDRIYTTNNAFVGMFKEWAIKHGCFYLKEQTFKTTVFMFNDIEYDLNNYDPVWVNVSPRINNYMFYPYIDTFPIKIKGDLDRLYTCIFEDDGYYDEDDDDNYRVVAVHSRTSGSRYITNLGNDLGLRGCDSDY